MKIHSVALARVIWLFDFAEFNPKGLNLWPLCEWLIGKYRFSGYPKNLLDLDSEKALSFQFGSFINSNKENVLISLSVYNNGLAANASSSTEDAEQFLQQLAVLVNEQFAMKVPSNLRRGYVSQLEVESNFILRGLNPVLPNFAELLAKNASTLDGKSRQFDFGVLQLWSDDVNPATSPAYFRFERKVGLPFSSNRFFSQAALPTRDHREFLASFEKALEVQNPNS